ncbi:T9SS type B sorting domain-containing protein [Lentimicrobium sp. L6]|uniref:immunoglobulin domain-containing protein n=1 Tax=Lentimicrobium sp. L6 TaxID=2735916 RepID=UPI0015550077|nr:immunoglobulin domain-containing protein [Lentimicrobium sp. L6]NPD85412.1 T9SS type B sorting domain-containing protein [Lentimicrobium sp. L6]
MKNMLLFSFLKKSINPIGYRLWIVLLGLFFAFSATSQNDLWIPKADLGDGSPSLKRTGAVSFTINGKVYIALGKAGSTYHQDLWQYDTVTEAWTQKANFAGVGRIGAFAMVVNNQAIVGTGEVAGGSRTNTVFKYNALSNSWSAIAAFSGGARSYASAFSIGTSGFVVGGDDGSFRNDLWKYNFNNNTWTSRAAFPGTARIKAVAFTIGTMAYYGTGDIGVGAYSQDFYSYNTNTDIWTPLADFPGGIRGGAIGCSNGTTGYVGLGNNGTYLTDFWSFDGTNWDQKTDFTGNARELAVASAVGNKVYVGTGFGGNDYKDFFQWDPCAIPQITVHPVGLDVCEAYDITLTVEIGNPSTETYEWTRNGSPVGGNSNILSIIGVTTADNGSYICEITNACGTATSDAALLNVTAIPVNSPTGLSVTPDMLCPDNNFDITLSANNNGVNTDTLRWYTEACGGILLGTGYPVNNDLIVAAPDPLAETKYYARWENQCGVTDCVFDSVMIKEIAVEPTTITTSLDTICLSFSDSLFLSVEGGAGDSLVWYIGDICTNPNAERLDTGMRIDLFTLGKIPTQTTTYSARWESYCGGSDFSSSCLLVDVYVNGEFFITPNPQNKTVCEGTESVFFSVDIDSGESLTDLFYQWYFGNNALSGATSDTLWLTGGITPADDGYYKCKIYNSCDTLVSDSAKLTVNLLPNIILEPSVLDTICEGDSLTMHLQVEGTPVIQNQWYFNNVAISAIDTFLTINPASFANTGEYYCITTNGCGSDTSAKVNIEVDTIPFVVTQPLDQIVCLNADAVFEVIANGTLPINYQWYKIDDADVSVVLPGETGSTFSVSPVLAADTAFSYYCMLSNECSDGPSSDTVSLSMYKQVVKMDSIVSDTNNLCLNYPTYIELTVYGGLGDSIRWFSGACDGDLFTVTADTTLEIGAPSETTTFYARWETPCGVSNCDSLTIIIKEDPIIPDTTILSLDTICYNYNDELFVKAEGGYGDSLVWYKGDICTNPAAEFIVAGDTLDLFALGQIPTETTMYSVRYEVYCGPDESYSECKTFTIYVDGEITITRHPQNKSVCEGIDSVMFFIKTDQTEALTSSSYQWFQNDIALASATNDTLIVYDVTPADSGYYYCKVYHACDTLASDSAFLTVNMVPEIITQPIVFDTICEGDSLSFFVEAQGSPILQYQWNFKGVPTSDNDSIFIINPASFLNTGNYYCIVSNGCSSDTSVTVHVEVDTIPYITTQPIDQIVCLNGTAQFNTEAEGTLPVAYQWYKIDGAGVSSVISGQSSPDLEITPVTVIDTLYHYYCLVSNECYDGISTDTVALEMYSQLQVMDSIVSDVYNVCYNYPTYLEFTVHGGVGDSIHWFTGSCEGQEYAITVDTTLSIEVPAGTTTFYARWENSCGVSACDSIVITVSEDPEAIDYLEFEDNGICINQYDSLRLTAYGGSGDSIYWFKGIDSEPFEITVDTFIYETDIPANDNVYRAQWVNACGASFLTQVLLDINDQTSISLQTDEVNVCEGEEAFLFVIADGIEPFTYQWFYEGVAIAGESNDTLFIDAVLEPVLGDYYCNIHSDCDTVSSEVIVVSMKENPRFVEPLLNDTAFCIGTNAELIVHVTGESPLLYQWFRDGNSQGAPFLNDSILAIEPVLETADYYVKVFNECTTTYSDTINLRALENLEITEHPQHVSSCLLETVSFSVETISTEFVTYTWYKDTNPTVIGTESTLVIANIDFPDEGQYYCVIADTCGEITSDYAILNINEPPHILNNPYGATVCEGTFFQFEVLAEGDSLNYVWYKNGFIVPSEENNILPFDPIIRGDEGSYTVDVINNCGEDQSVPVELLVDYLPNLLDSLVAVPDSICPECDYDSIQLIAYGDGGGYGDYIEWYVDEVSPDNVVGVGSSINVALPTSTTNYFAFWINDCAPSGSGIGNGGTGGGSGDPLMVTVHYIEYAEPPTTVIVNVNDFCITSYDSITLSGSGGFGERLNWFIIDGSDETYIGHGESLTVVQPIDTTIYAAHWTNFCGHSDSVVIQVNVVPLPEVYLTDGDTICSGQEYTPELVVANYYDSLQWSTTSLTGYFDTANIMYPTYYDPGLINHDTTRVFLILKAYGQANCEDAIDSIELYHHPIPFLTYNPLLTAICRDSIITLTGEGAEEYIWKPIDSDEPIEEGNPMVFSPDVTTDYYIIGTSSEGCLDSVSFTIDVYATPLVDLGDSLFMYSCEPVQLDAGGGDGSEYYIWNNGFRTRAITVYETGNYSVIVGNPGCEVSDTGYVSLCNGRMFMPTAFTPNADGLNERFKPITSDPSVEFHMMIFDRLGKMLFETYDIHEGWDGDVDGEACPAGNYVWRIDYQGQGTSAPGKKGSEVGTVMLVR